VHVPRESQNMAMGSQGASGGQTLHGAPHSFPAHGSKPPPETPPLLVPPPETPPLLAPPPETPPLLVPPFDAPPFPVSPASPAAGTSSASESVDCPPHAPAKTTTVPSAKICLVTPGVYYNPWSLQRASSVVGEPIARV
jgi:hypothetical protein